MLLDNAEKLLPQDNAGSLKVVNCMLSSTITIRIYYMY